MAAGLAAAPAERGSAHSQVLIPSTDQREGGPITALGPRTGPALCRQSSCLCEGRRPLGTAYLRQAEKPHSSTHRRGASSTVPEKRPLSASVGEEGKEPPCLLLPLRPTFMLR